MNLAPGRGLRAQPLTARNEPALRLKAGVNSEPGLASNLRHLTYTSFDVYWNYAGEENEPGTVPGVPEKAAGDQTAQQFASRLGISPQYLSDVYNGRRPPGESITAALQVEKSVVYKVPTPSRTAPSEEEK